MHWQQITLVGVGLLGGSLGLAIKQRRLAQRVVGFVRRAASVQECEALAVCDEATRDVQTAVRAADLIIFCTPIAQMRELAERMLPAVKPGIIATDVGSVKEIVVEDLEPTFARVGAHFVGSHPMAGAEKIGVRAAQADLFNKAVCVVTPTASVKMDAVEKVEEFWRCVGAVPIRMSPETHDDLVSRSSHLPHVVAAELANYVLSPVHPKEQGLLCANGFRDTTRIASGSPEMWRDICLANRVNLARVLGVFIEDLEEFRIALDNSDTKSIEEFFHQAKRRRDQWGVEGRMTSEE
ncbi:MAG: prephenate dehydrogenase/arogenate dehydrogenase family protein [Verrucomicrobia subdivision 3 bacterium]|nr:prephenate dehydrogenase/arogenate dehydrogenase family protein [Limisphaerales bacterium]